MFYNSKCGGFILNNINKKLQQLTKHLIKNLKNGGIETTDLNYYNNIKNDLLLQQRLNKHDEFLKD